MTRWGWCGQRGDALPPLHASFLPKQIHTPQKLNPSPHSHPQTQSTPPSRSHFFISLSTSIFRPPNYDYIYIVKDAHSDASSFIYLRILQFDPPRVNITKSYHKKQIHGTYILSKYYNKKQNLIIYHKFLSQNFIIFLEYPPPPLKRAFSPLYLWIRSVLYSRKITYLDPPQPILAAASQFRLAVLSAILNRRSEEINHALQSQSRPPGGFPTSTTTRCIIP